MTENPQDPKLAELLKIHTGEGDFQHVDRVAWSEITGLQASEQALVYSRKQGDEILQRYQKMSPEAQKAFKENATPWQVALFESAQMRNGDDTPRNFNKGTLNLILEGRKVRLRKANEGIPQGAHLAKVDHAYPTQGPDGKPGFLVSFGTRSSGGGGLVHLSPDAFADLVLAEDARDEETLRNLKNVTSDQAAAIRILQFTANGHELPSQDDVSTMDRLTPSIKAIKNPEWTKNAPKATDAKARQTATDAITKQVEALAVAEKELADNTDEQKKLGLTTARDKAKDELTQLQTKIKEMNTNDAKASLAELVSRYGDKSPTGEELKNIFDAANNLHGDTIDQKIVELKKTPDAENAQQTIAFLGTLKDPAFREQLSQSLQSGHLDPETAKNIQELLGSDSVLDPDKYIKVMSGAQVAMSESASAMSRLRESLNKKLDEKPGETDEQKKARRLNILKFMGILGFSALITLLDAAMSPESGGGGKMTSQITQILSIMGGHNGNMSPNEWKEFNEWKREKQMAFFKPKTETAKK